MWEMFATNNNPKNANEWDRAPLSESQKIYKLVTTGCCKDVSKGDVL